MERYIVTSISGGTGRTVVSLAFAKYLHLYLGKAVNFITTDPFIPFLQICKDLPIEFVESPLDVNKAFGKKNGEVQLLDLHQTILTRPFEDYLTKETALIIPAQADAFSRIKLKSCLIYLSTLKLRWKDTFILPNEYSEKLTPGAIDEFSKFLNFKEFQHIPGLNLLPSLGRSRLLTEVGHPEEFSPNFLNLVRPVFSRLI